MVEKNFNTNDILSDKELERIKLKVLLNELKDGDIETIYKFLYSCVKRGEINLPPDVYLTFLKLKSNLIKYGFKLTNNQIKQYPKDEVIKELLKVRENIKKEEEYKQLVENNPYEDGTKEIDFNKDKELQRIKEVLEVDTSLFEKERLNIREQLLGEKHQIRIKLGRKFSITMNQAMTIIEMILPKSYEIDIDDKLLIELFNKKFGINIETEKITKEKVERILSQNQTQNEEKNKENNEKEKGEEVITDISLGEKVEKKVKLETETIKEDKSLIEVIEEERLKRESYYIPTKDKTSEKPYISGDVKNYKDKNKIVNEKTETNKELKELKEKEFLNISSSLNKTKGKKPSFDVNKEVEKIFSYISDVEIITNKDGEIIKFSKLVSGNIDKITKDDIKVKPNNKVKQELYYTFYQKYIKPIKNFIENKLNTTLLEISNSNNKNINKNKQKLQLLEQFIKERYPSYITNCFLPMEDKLFKLSNNELIICIITNIFEEYLKQKQENNNLTEKDKMLIDTSKLVISQLFKSRRKRRK